MFNYYFLDFFIKKIYFNWFFNNKIDILFLKYIHKDCVI